jgi:4a-hydroxytetrahydrobiopterin dehydratase
MPKLCDMTCKACRGDLPALRGDELRTLAQEVPDWAVVKDHHLERTFRFADFAGAMVFAMRVGRLAEEENHHPTITFTWGKAIVRVYTHKVDGLSESDFVLAAKIDAMLSVKVER